MGQLWVKYKRIIAKEFLILLSVAVFTFGVMFFLDSYQERRNQNIREITSHYGDSETGGGYQEWSVTDSERVAAEVSRRKRAEDYGEIFLISLWVLIYPIRLIYYITKWSIRTIKEPTLTSPKG